jgi:hypothetical protein
VGRALDRLTASNALQSYTLLEETGTVIAQAPRQHLSQAMAAIKSLPDIESAALVKPRVSRTIIPGG